MVGFEPVEGKTTNQREAQALSPSVGSGFPQVAVMPARVDGSLMSLLGVWKQLGLSLANALKTGLICLQGSGQGLVIMLNPTPGPKLCHTQFGLRNSGSQYISDFGAARQLRVLCLGQFPFNINQRASLSIPAKGPEPCFDLRWPIPV